MHPAQFVRTAAAASGLLLACLLAACSGQKKADEIKLATESAARLQEGVVDFATNKQHWPSKMEELNVEGDEMPGISYSLGEGGVVVVYFAEGAAMAGAHLIYTPTQDAQGGVTWSCISKGFDAATKPSGCT